MRIAIVYGTRPEQIKLTPVAEALEARGVDIDWAFSNQSPDLADSDDKWFKKRWLSLGWGIGRLVESLSNYLDVENYDAVLVQGDTATAFAGAVAGFLAEVPVGHVEAGLRTYSSEPYPEEAFRHAIASFADFHFCPDEDSAWNLIDEFGGHYNNIFITGNPIIDTLDSEPFRVLVTLHRRENWGERIKQARTALFRFTADNGGDVVTRVVKHPNWDQHQEEGRYISSSLYEEVSPVDHITFTEWMKQADLVVTDSGGLQEEAAHFGVDCIVYRTKTERTALERSGAVRVCDPSEPEKLAQMLSEALQKRRAYGDGTAGRQIADILIEELQNDPT